MTEQNDPWKNRLNQLRDVINRYAAKAKQRLLLFWHELPDNWDHLKSKTKSIIRSSKAMTVSTWRYLKAQWQGKPDRVLKRPDKQSMSDDADEPMDDSERSLQPFIQARSLTKVPQRRKKTKPIRRTGRLRVYRLKGYTTVAKVNRKHNAELQQQLLRKLLLFVGVILLLIILFYLYNPVSDLSELYRIIGISDIADLTENNPLFPDITPTPRP